MSQHDVETMPSLSLGLFGALPARDPTVSVRAACAYLDDTEGPLLKAGLLVRFLWSEPSGFIT